MLSNTTLKFDLTFLDTFFIYSVYANIWMAYSILFRFAKLCVLYTITTFIPTLSPKQKKYSHQTNNKLQNNSCNLWCYHYLGWLKQWLNFIVYPFCRKKRLWKIKKEMTRFVQRKTQWTTSPKVAPNFSKFCSSENPVFQLKFFSALPFLEAFMTSNGNIINYLIKKDFFKKTIAITTNIR